MTKSSKQKVSLEFFKYIDFEGNHTCCTLWGEKEYTCKFLQAPYNMQERCGFPGAEILLERRDFDRGTLIPGEMCPFA